MTTINGTEVSTLSDEQLFNAIKNTDNEALKKECFGVVIEHNYKPLKAFVGRIVRDEIEDVVHNTFIKAYENILQFTGESTVSTWLHAIARNDALNLVRAAERHPPEQDVDYLDVLEDNDTGEPEEVREQVVKAFTDPNTPESIYASVEILNQVEDEISKLHPHLQDLFQMRYIEQMEYHEIAAYLAIPIGSVSKRIHEISQVIKKVLNK